MSPLTVLLEPLQYEFMVRALTTSVIAALVCSLLSCWLVLVGWSLMGDAVSHAVLPGVVLAYIAGVPFLAGALVFGLLAVALIGVVRGSGRIKEDAAIGIVFTTLFATGLVLISITPSQTDLAHIVFGNVLGVSQGQLGQVTAVAAVVVAVLVLRRRDLVLWAFDPLHARAIGLSTARLGALMLVLLALTSVVALQVVGVVLVVALLIIPGATAQLLTLRFGRMLVLAPTTSVLSSVTGLYLSYWWDASPAGLIVVVHGVVFALVLALTRGPEVVRAGASRTARRWRSARA